MCMAEMRVPSAYAWGWRHGAMILSEEGQGVPGMPQSGFAMVAQCAPQTMCHHTPSLPVESGLYINRHIYTQLSVPEQS